ncbi:glycosyltransferase [Williamsia sp. M5A3_1d]
MDTVRGTEVRRGPSSPKTVMQAGAGQRMVGYLVSDRVARAKNALNPLTPIRRRYPQFRPFRYDAGYQSWMDNVEQGEFLPPASDLGNPFGDEPWFSIVIPMFNTPSRHLEALVRSLLGQTFGSFEVVMADASTDRLARASIKRACDADPRLRYRGLASNDGISQNTNQAIEWARGSFVVFVDHDDVLAPQALNEVAAYVRRHPDTDVLYSDEDLITEDGVWRHSPQFKPDWSPHLFMSCNYTNHMSVVRRDLLARTYGLDSRFDGAQDYEFVLRLHTVPGRRVVGHIPRVLYHWRQAQGSTSTGNDAKPHVHEAGRIALETTLRSLGHSVAVSADRDSYGPYEAVFRVADGTHLLVVWIGDCAESAESLFDVTDVSQFASTRMLRLATDEGLDEILDECESDAVVAIIRRPVCTDDPQWVAQLVGVAQSDAVIAVAPRLVDRDGVVTDMGLVRDGDGRLRRLFAGLEMGAGTVFGSNEWGRDVTALTGDVVVSTRRNMVRPPARAAYHVVWPVVTMTVIEHVGEPSSAFNPNLIGLSNGRIAVRSGI